MDLTAIIIIAIVSSAIVSIIKILAKHNRDKISSNAQVSSSQQDLTAQIQALQERVNVLESIVTDEKYSLNKAFSELKD